MSHSQTNIEFDYAFVEIQEDFIYEVGGFHVKLPNGDIIENPQLDEIHEDLWAVWMGY